MSGDEHSWQDEVQSALKRYGRAGELGAHSAREWPAVAALSAAGRSPAEAIRLVLEQGITALEQRRGAEAALLRAHYLGGRSISALATEYAVDASSLHRRRNALVSELALVLAERNQHVTHQSRTRRFVPRQPIVGLERLVDELVAELADPSGAPVLVIEGMGGLGKTTLAQLLAAHVAREALFAGVLWVSAKQIDFDLWAGTRRAARGAALRAADVLAELAGELELALHGDTAALRAEVLARCRSQAYVIVIDNLETVEDMAALAPTIAELAGLSRVVLTTRDRALDALPATLPRRYVPLSELDAPTSYALLRSAARTTGAPALAAAPDDALARIYDVTGGNPLALWLVAGQAHDVPWEAFVNDLAAHRPASRSGYELYSYLYRRSWEQLSDDARLVLFAMHRCEGGATFEQLHELSGLGDEAFTRAVAELRTRMLLQLNERYHIHRLTQTFLRVVIAGWWG